MSKKISVLCVDDSALIRQVMTEIINGQPDLQVVGAANAVLRCGPQLLGVIVFFAQIVPVEA